MPSISNSNYRLGAKRLTTRSIAVALLLAVTVVGRASVDEVVRWNKVATDATVAAKINPLAESRHLRNPARGDSRCSKCG